MKMGIGEYSFSNGDTYCGEFTNEKRDGKGTYIWKEGEILKGWWQSDQLNGDYTFIDNEL